MLQYSFGTHITSEQLRRIAMYLRLLSNILSSDCGVILIQVIYRVFDDEVMLKKISMIVKLKVNFFLLLFILSCIYITMKFDNTFNNQSSL